MKSIRLNGVGHLAPKPDWFLPQKTHSFHELIVVFRGKKHVVINQETITAVAGDILLYRAGCPHEERTDPVDVMETYFIAFDWDNLPHWASIHLHDTHGYVRQLIQWLYEKWHEQDPSPVDVRSAFLHALLCEWLCLHKHQEHALIQAVRNHVKRDFSSGPPPENCTKLNESFSRTKG